MYHYRHLLFRMCAIFYIVPGFSNFLIGFLEHKIFASVFFPHSYNLGSIAVYFFLKLELPKPRADPWWIAPEDAH